MSVFVEDMRFEGGACALVRGANVPKLKDWVEPYFKVVEESPAFCVASIDVAGEWCRAHFNDGTIRIGQMADDRPVEYEVMALLRLLFKLCALDKGFMNMHAACVSLDDVSFLLAADRNGGKTTSLFNILNHPGAKFVGNDQITIREDGTALGYPAAVGVRGGLGQGLENDICAKAAWFADDSFMVHRKPILHYRCFAAMSGAAISPSAKIDALVEYRRSDVQDVLTIERYNDVERALKALNLPCSKAYSSNLIDICKRSLAYYGWDASSITDSMNQLPTRLTYLQVLCGGLRLPELAAAITREMQRKWQA